MTNDSHFNPCFWTALWNDMYLETVIRGPGMSRIPRDELVACLNLCTRRVRTTKVSTVHKHKGIGFVEFTYASAKKYREALVRIGKTPPAVRKWRADDAVFLDAEAFFSGLETMPTYKAVLDVVRNGKIGCPTEKINLASFFVIHNERLAAAWLARPNRLLNQKDHNLEHLLLLKQRLADHEYLFSRVVPLVTGAWYVHAYSKSVLLLGDSGFPASDTDFMAAISPRHLVVIDVQRSMHAHLFPTFQNGDLDLAEKYNQRVASLSRYEIIGPQSELEKIS